MDIYDKDKLLNMFIERENLNNDAHDFVDEHEDNNGTLSAEDFKIAEEKIEGVRKMTKEIDRELSKPTTQPILPIIGNNGLNYNYTDTAKFGVSGREYQNHLINAIRTNFTVRNEVDYLAIGDQSSGGYLLSEEMHDHILTEMREKNILRQISTVISTQSKHRIILQGQAPAAEWLNEGDTIPTTNQTFAEKTIDAYKLGASINISNELLSDSFYNLEDFISKEFGEALARKEEQAFFTGDGNGKPLGILSQIDYFGSSIETVTTAGNSLAADDLINTVYKLGSEYRRNASWIMNTSTLAAIRKLKDANQNYLWENQLTAETPARLLGYPVFTSDNIPAIAAGNTAVLFGDFSKFIIANRGNMVFKPLREINALRDLTTFVILSRVDCCLTDSKAITALKIKS